MSDEHPDIEGWERPYIVRELERAQLVRAEAMARCEQAARRVINATHALRKAQTELVLAADAHLKSCADAERSLAYVDQLRCRLLGAVLTGDES